MITSYLLILLSRQAVTNDQVAEITHLICFRILAVPLDVDQFRNVIAIIDVVASANTLIEAESLQNVPQVIEREARIRVPRSSFKSSLSSWLIHPLPPSDRVVQARS